MKLNEEEERIVKSIKLKIDEINVLFEETFSNHIKVSGLIHDDKDFLDYFIPLQ